MAVWAHSDVLDKGPNEIRARANKMVLLKAYSTNDPYYTVMVTNNVAEVTMTVADNNFYEFTSSGNDRVLTAKTATRSATATANATAADLHIAFVESGSPGTVLWVTNETSDQNITSGNTVNFPATNLTYKVNQPTAV